MVSSREPCLAPFFIDEVRGEVGSEAVGVSRHDAVIEREGTEVREMVSEWIVARRRHARCDEAVNGNDQEATMPMHDVSMI